MSEWCAFAALMKRNFTVRVYNAQGEHEYVCEETGEEVVVPA